MSRIIKFRVWVESLLPEETGMYYPDYVSWYSNKDGSIDKVYTAEFKFKEDTCKFTLLQWIGQQDINGKDIYEGDICRQYWNGHEIIAPMVYNEAKCQFGLDAEVDFDPETDHLEIKVPRNTGPEVIGNIFDNPELVNAV